MLLLPAGEDGFLSCLGVIGASAAGEDCCVACLHVGGASELGDCANDSVCGTDGSPPDGASSLANASHSGKRERPRAASNVDADSDRQTACPISTTRLRFCKPISHDVAPVIPCSSRASATGLEVVAVSATTVRAFSSRCRRRITLLDAEAARETGSLIEAL